MNQSLKVISVFLLSFLFITNFSTAFSAENAGNLLRGQYRLTTLTGDNSNIIFYLRSSGSAGIVRGNGVFEHASIDFYLMQGLSNLGPEPLPIGHILITYGSDENTTRLIVRLVKSGEGQISSIQIIDAINTVVDGPNDSQGWAPEKILLERWEPTQKKWIAIN